MKNIVVKGTKKRYKGRWVAGVNTTSSFMWVICADHEEAIKYATVMANWLADWKRKYG